MYRVSAALKDDPLLDLNRRLPCSHAAPAASGNFVRKSPDLVDSSEWPVACIDMLPVQSQAFVEPGQKPAMTVLSPILDRLIFWVGRWFEELIFAEWTTLHGLSLRLATLFEMGL